MRRLLLFAVGIASIAHTALAQTLEGRLKQISETKVVKLAHRSDANPFSFVNAQSQPDGYTVDLCKVVVHSLELQLNSKLTIAWVPVDTQNRFDAVATGLADMECGSSTVSFERMAKVEFSSIIFMENTGVLVQTSSGISSVADLGGKKIAVIAGTRHLFPVSFPGVQTARDDFLVDIDREALERRDVQIRAGGLMRLPFLQSRGLIISGRKWSQLID